MKFEIVKHTISETWLPALINDDWSGLTDAEETELKEWLGTINGYIAPGSDDEMVPGFQTDEISGLMANCITVNEIIDPRLLKSRRDR